MSGASDPPGGDAAGAAPNATPQQEPPNGGAAVAAPRETLREQWVGGVAGAVPQETLREQWVGGVAGAVPQETVLHPSVRGASGAAPAETAVDAVDAASAATQREQWVGGVSPPAAPSADAGEPFGRYRLHRELGHGAMGVVYKAWDTELKRWVALKTLLLRTPQTPAGAPVPPALADDSETVQRFHREARAAARLRHPNVVQVHDVGSCAGRHYITMDFIEGESLEEAFARLELRRVVEIVRDVARALQVAHEAGIIHRDVKPANVLLDRSGRPYVGDFGLAKTAQEAAHRKLTLEGAVMGTPYYMSPEQAEGAHDRMGPASDQWSMGVILYRALAGGFPFDHPTVVVLLSQILSEDPVPPAQAAARRPGRPAVPRDLETVCLKCLEKHPPRRFASMAALADELDRWLQGEPILSRRSGWFERTGLRARRHRGLAVALAIIAVLAPGFAITASFLRARSGELARKTQSQEARQRAEPSCLEGRQKLEEALAVWKTQVLRWQTVGSRHKTVDQFLAEPGCLERATERAERFGQARARIDRALELDADYALALAVRAEIALAAGDLGAASFDAERALGLDPSCIPARVARALAALREYERDRGAPYRLEFTAPEPGAAGRVRIRKGDPETRSQVELRERAAAEVAALRGVAAAPAAGATAQAALLYCEGKTTEAEAAIDAVLSRSPSDPEAQFWAGRICAATGDAERAGAFLTALLLLRPDDPSTRCAYGAYLALEGDLAGGAAQFARATAGTPDFVRGWIELAGASTALERHAQAVAALETAVRLRPQDPLLPIHLNDAKRRQSQAEPDRNPR